MYKPGGDGTTSSIKTTIKIVNRFEIIHMEGLHTLDDLHMLVDMEMRDVPVLLHQPAIFPINSHKITIQTIWL